MFITTLLANPEKQPLTKDLAHLIAGAISMQGAIVEKTEWLAEDTACNFYTNREPQIDEILRGYMFDAIIQQAPKQKYKLLISDMDSTMISCECIDELADFAGKKKEVAEITHRAMNGELVFEETLAARVALLAGLPEETLQKCFDERVRVMPGAKELITAHKKNDGYSVLVSGGFTFFTSRVAKELGFDEHHSNTLEIKGGKLTGRVIPPILGKEAKLKTLKETCQKLGIKESHVIAIGDGANDLPMLLAAGLGVAYRAKPTVRAQAKAQLNHCDLSALKYLL